jgi:alpha-galactosidase
MAAEQHGFASAHWNMYNNEDSSKGMGPWTTAERDNPSLRTFDTDPAEALITRYEAEEGALSGGVVVSAEHPGFSGTGYAAYPASIGANVHCEVNGYIPTDDTYVAEIHYADSAAITMRLQSLNDAAAVVDDQSVLFPATGGTDNWATLRVQLDFEAGEDARLRIIADTDPGPIIDHIRLTR